MPKLKDFRLEEGYFSVVETAGKLGISKDSLFTYVDMGVVPPAQHSWRGSARKYYKSEELPRMKEQIADLKLQYAKQQLKRYYKQLVK